MKLLLDMNLPRGVGEYLNSIGHVARHVGDIGMARTEDADILEEALRHHEVVLTHDLDYGHLLSFSGASGPSGVISRVRRTDEASLAQRLTRDWIRIEPSLLAGAIVIIEDGASRIRAKAPQAEADRVAIPPSHEDREPELVVLGP